MLSPDPVFLLFRSTPDLSVMRTPTQKKKTSGLVLGRSPSPKKQLAPPYTLERLPAGRVADQYSLDTYPDPDEAFWLNTDPDPMYVSVFI
jgi:hypothetical protein